MTAKRSAPANAPTHPDAEILDSEIGFARHLSVEVVRFRHRLFAGGWSGERVFDVVRRGAAAAILLYDPDEDRVVLVEQFRMASSLAGGAASGCSTWYGGARRRRSFYMTPTR